jgi:hypothetical protein
MFNNLSGFSNTAVGQDALKGNVSGQFNTSIGMETQSLTTASNNNVTIGYQSGSEYDMGWNNTLIGAKSMAGPGTFNSVAIGYQSYSYSNNNVRLGNGNTVSVTSFAPYSVLSDGRFKRNIQEDVKGLDFIMKLRPVTYHLDVAGLNEKLNIKFSDEDKMMKKSVIDKEKIVYTGFIAQEVEQAANQTGYDFSGIVKPQNEKDMYSLSYAEFVVPLVKAMQEQQQLINDLKKLNSQLVQRIEKLENK